MADRYDRDPIPPLDSSLCDVIEYRPTSRRDQFAMAALSSGIGLATHTADSIANWCYEVADAMLRRRNKDIDNG